MWWAGAGAGIGILWGDGDSDGMQFSEFLQSKINKFQLFKFLKLKIRLSSSNVFWEWIDHILPKFHFMFSGTY